MLESLRFRSKTELHFELRTSAELKKKKNKFYSKLGKHVGNGGPKMGELSLYSAAEEEGLVPEEMVTLISSCGEVSALMSIKKAVQAIRPLLESDPKLLFPFGVSDKKMRWGHEHIPFLR